MAVIGETKEAEMRDVQMRLQSVYRDYHCAVCQRTALVPIESARYSHVWDGEVDLLGR